MESYLLEHNIPQGFFSSLCLVTVTIHGTMYRQPSGLIFTYCHIDQLCFSRSICLLMNHELNNSLFPSVILSKQALYVWTKKYNFIFCYTSAGDQRQPHFVPEVRGSHTDVRVPQPREGDYFIHIYVQCGACHHTHCFCFLSEVPVINWAAQ